MLGWLGIVKPRRGSEIRVLGTCLPTWLSFFLAHSTILSLFLYCIFRCAYIDFVLASTAKQVADLRQIRVGGRTVSVRPFGANTVNTHFPRFEYPTTVTSLNKIIQEQNDTRIDRGRVASSAVHRTPTHMGVGRQQMPPQQGGNQGGNNRNQGGNGNRMNQTQRPAYATPRANGGRNGDNVAKKTRTVTSSVVATVTNPAACSTTGAPAQATEAPKGGDQKQGGVETAIPDASKINSQNEVGAPTTTGEAAVDSPKSDVTAEVKEVAA